MNVNFFGRILGIFSKVLFVYFFCSDEKNAFEALAVGASMSIGLVANIAVMLIAFLSMLKFVNSVLGWLGGMVGLPEFSFEVSCFV